MLFRSAIIGQAFPYTPIANPRYKIPAWSFGIREEQLRATVGAARAGGAGLVVLLSHNGFDVDRKLASRVAGIDVILSGHTHDAVPAATKVGSTLLIASGSHGKFLSRLDLDVGPNGVRDFHYRLIPVFTDVVESDAAMSKLVHGIRSPHDSHLSEKVGRTDSLLYRRDNLNGTFDDLICAAMIEGRDAEVALSPGFRWGASLLPGETITRDAVYNQTAITYPETYRTTMTGENLKLILEDVADNLFNPDPYYQQGGDMVRVGGIGFELDANGERGNRIRSLVSLRDGAVIEASKEYVVAGWASVNEGVEGPPIWDVVTEYLQARDSVRFEPNDHVRLVT